MPHAFGKFILVEHILCDLIEDSVLSENRELVWQAIHTIVFDFDGVFTNNKVWLNENGVETVCCDQ